MTSSLFQASLALILMTQLTAFADTQRVKAENIPPSGHVEAPDDPHIAVPRSFVKTSPMHVLKHNGRIAHQVNVAAGGANIVGDAANEPSIAVDPTDPNKIVIGWRQFDTITSNFRQAGYAYSTDRGQTWTFPGVINPGVFRSDPVLDFDAAGNFYYNSLTVDSDFHCDVYTSTDGGMTWGAPTPAYGHDKQWMAIDRTGGPGDGHIYQQWSPFINETFNRSVDGNASFEIPILVPEQPYYGTNTVGPDGAVYVSGNSYWSYGIAVVRSSDAQDSATVPMFDQTTVINFGGDLNGNDPTSPNPDGLLGQTWIAADHSDGTYGGNLYLVASVDPPGADPMDVHFVRSTDSGATWSTPVRINDDASDTNAWQWFGTMSVAPDGRIDVIWNDTRNDPGGYLSELNYAFSTDGGLTWSANEVLTVPFDPHLGWPQQNKIGDYYDMVSDDSGAHIAFSATFNGEQDVYYMHLDPLNIFSDNFESADTDAWSSATPNLSP